MENRNNTNLILDNLYRKYAGELCKQYDLLNGFSGLTKTYAKIQFVKALNFDKDYPIYLSIPFHKNQFKTIANQNSIYGELKLIAKGKAPTKDFKKITKNGIEGIYKYKPKINEAYLPFDFSSKIAKNLINEFSNKGKVLDPCHGWGGRMIGFMLSNAKFYHGIDPSKEQNFGVNNIWNYFKDVLNDSKDIKLTCECFENVNLRENHYDFAITSPPYYDHEKYIGINQSYKLYNNYEKWVDEFLTKLIEKVYFSLKDNSYFAIKIGDLQYPLIDDIKKIAEKTGFELNEIRNKDTDELYNTLSTSIIMIFRK